MGMYCVQSFRLSKPGKVQCRTMAPALKVKPTKKAMAPQTKVAAMTVDGGASGYVRIAASLIAATFEDTSGAAA